MLNKMQKQEFVEDVLTRLFETFMPPGMEEAEPIIKEKYGREVDNLERMAWDLYEYSEGDRPLIRQKLVASAREVVFEKSRRTGLSSVEIGLLAPDAEDYEIEEYFEGRTINQALMSAIEWAEEQGYSVEEPDSGSHPLDYEIDGRKLTQMRG